MDTQIVDPQKVSQYFHRIKSRKMSKNDLCRDMAKLMAQNEVMAAALVLAEKTVARWEKKTKKL